MLKHIFRFISTLSFLKPRQIFARIFRKPWSYFCLKFLVFRTPPASVLPQLKQRFPEEKIANQISIFADSLDPFTLNWRTLQKPKLWQYHLHYFDYLDTCSKDCGLFLIEDWIKRNPQFKSVGWNPYPISIRTVNWIHFLVKYNIIPGDPVMNSLYLQLQILWYRREFHLLANHYFKNLTALLYLTFMFQQKQRLKWVLTELQKQLKEQGSLEGMHFEYSPTYHVLWLNDLLDIVNLLQHNDIQQMETFQEPFCEAFRKGLLWVNHLFRQHNYLNIADVNYEGCPSPDRIIEYARNMNIIPNRDQQFDSSSLFPIIQNKGLELMLLNAPFNPSYNPAHSHADKLSALLWFHEQPILVDTGNYQYTADAQRLQLRSVAAHNTLQIDNLDQADLWSAFRVGRRGKVVETKVLPDSTSSLFQHWRYWHHREIRRVESGLCILDKIKCKGLHIARLYFHLAPGIKFTVQKNQVLVETVISIRFQEGNLEVMDSNFYPALYRAMPNKVISLSYKFNDEIEILTYLEV